MVLTLREGILGSSAGFKFNNVKSHGAGFTYIEFRFRICFVDSSAQFSGDHRVG